MSLTTTTNPAVRTVDGAEVPAAGVYALDASHSQVGFAVRHLMVSKTKGRFSDFAGTIQIGENPLDSSVEVTIQAASIDTRDEQRDGHLRSGDFFDSDAYPTLTYRSRSVRPAGGEGEYVVEGDLTIKGVTQRVEGRGTLTGPTTDIGGNERIGLELETTIDRTAYGLDWNAPLPNGGLVVANDVKLEVALELAREQ